MARAKKHPYRNLILISVAVYVIALSIKEVCHLESPWYAAVSLLVSFAPLVAAGILYAVRTYPRHRIISIFIFMVIGLAALSLVRNLVVHLAAL